MRPGIEGACAVAVTVAARSPQSSPCLLALGSCLSIAEGSPAVFRNPHLEEQSPAGVPVCA